ncbi:hypothetical protein [Pseudoruegeria sp. SHC-113]|uniref:hypothetical protein n=1 Tax=Pseudoruegeria sp. SHC-113 TaxID=2855439 RepID=UPI0021BB9808|nr:hypothetical protein [Pseudoruegeria sp. SHC-113]MCT8161340.1 hypothetical protein [Pseudoruegeria sp. SHC-113]
MPETFNWKRYALLGGALCVAASFAYGKTHLMQTGEGDFLFLKKFVSAQEVVEPKPGHAYAFHLRSRVFERTPICVKENADLKTSVETLGFISRNTVGENFNDAVDSMSGWLGENVVTFLKAEGAQKKWILSQQFDASFRSKFREDCLPAIEERLANGAYSVFIVDSVLRDPEKNNEPRIVVFKPEPLKPEACDATCERLAQLDTLLKPGWATKLKVRMEWVRVN